MKQILPILIACFLFVLCESSSKVKILENQNGSKITCTDQSCEGSYTGPEFIAGSDVAHQFSNKMSARVGDQLKELYKKEKYVKVDFSNILMSTKGMGSGYVTYFLKISFVAVSKKCDAYTSFDHVGGWNHKPALSARKNQLSKALLPGETLDISDLKTTDEGLQEYWIQWKNKTVQFDCNSRNLK